MGRTRGRFQKKIDYTRWIGGQVSELAFSASAQGQTFVTAIANHTETLMRIRGELTGWLDATSAPGVAIDVACGLLVQPAGTGTGITSSPITDEQAPWLWYERFTLAYEEMVTDVVDVPQMTSVRITVDNKAMRIFRPDREIQFVAEQVTVGSATSCNVSFNGRLLLGS